MSNWTTSSTTNGDLTGSMEMNADTVLSYTSTTLGASDGIPQMLGGSGLNFKVEWTTATGKSTPPKKTKYTIRSTKVSGVEKYDGTSSKDAAEESPEGTADDWVATETGPEEDTTGPEEEAC